MSRKSPAAGLPVSFEEAIAELKQLVSRMETGELPLDASVAAFQRGADLVKFCSGQLDRIENQVKVLEGEILVPFTVDSAEAEE